MKFIDCHCHLYEKVFLREIETYIRDWRQLGVVKVAVMSTNTKNSRKTTDLYKQFQDFIVPAIGRHPWGAHKFTEKDKEFYTNEIKKSEIKIIGEIGLDHYFIKEEEKYPKQQEVFDFFLDLAEKEQKPVMLHTTGAEEAIYNTLSSRKMTFKVCCHWFSGEKKILKKLADLGCFFSINPAIEKSKRHQEILRIVDSSKILTESDGPVKFRGNVGSPGVMPVLTKIIASKLNLLVEDLVERIYNNFQSYLR